MSNTARVTQNRPVNTTPVQSRNIIQYPKNVYSKIISKVRHTQGEKKMQDDKTNFKINNPNMIRGGLIGIAVSALLSWNAGKYSRLGIIRNRWKFIRNFIMVNKKPSLPHVFTNYYIPPLDTVVRNFMCYSGEAGIGKSSHFSNLAYTQSGIRPALYISFKASGKDSTFYEDIAEQAEYGGQCPSILSQIIKAAKRIDYINKFPHRFWLKIALSHVFFVAAIYGVAISTLEATYGMLIFSAITASYIYYLHFIYPLLIQSFRRTAPLIIFDDLNKIESLNLLPEVVRYLALLENNMSNVILVSPDEDTWCKLRRQPGVKDRLRVRQIYYNHIYTAQSMLDFINDDANFQQYMKYVNGNKLYNKDIVISLIKQLIGKRQVTLRRFTSILILNDQQQYQSLVQVLKQSAEGKISKGQAVQKFTDILYDSQAKTMVANLKNIKREVKITDQQFFLQLRTLLKKRKLASDNIIAPHLKAYNIVRDLQSQYVFNGRFMYTIFNMAIQEYETDMKEYQNLNQAPSKVLQPQSKKSQNILFDPIKAKQQKIEQKKIQKVEQKKVQKVEEKKVQKFEQKKLRQDKPTQVKQANIDEAIKNWNKSNILPSSNPEAGSKPLPGEAPKQTRNKPISSKQ